MIMDRYTKIILTVIAFVLVIISFQLTRTDIIKSAHASHTHDYYDVYGVARKNHDHDYADDNHDHDYDYADSSYYH